MIMEKLSADTCLTSFPGGVIGKRGFVFPKGQIFITIIIKVTAFNLSATLLFLLHKYFCIAKVSEK